MVNLNLELQENKMQEKKKVTQIIFKKCKKQLSPLSFKSKQFMIKEWN